jgi:hypothetical protein
VGQGISQLHHIEDHLDDAGDLPRLQVLGRRVDRDQHAREIVHGGGVVAGEQNVVRMGQLLVVPELADRASEHAPTALPQLPSPPFGLALVRGEEGQR